MDSKTKDSIIVQMRHIIEEYEQVTGIQVSSIEELKKLYELKQSNQRYLLEEAITKEERRKKRWRKASAILSLTTIAEAITIYFLVR